MFRFKEPSSGSVALVLR